jgi:hypothetical protein
MSIPPLVFLNGGFNRLETLIQVRPEKLLKLLCEPVEPFGRVLVSSVVWVLSRLTAPPFSSAFNGFD